MIFRKIFCFFSNFFLDEEKKSSDFFNDLDCVSRVPENYLGHPTVISERDRPRLWRKNRKISSDCSRISKTSNFVWSWLCISLSDLRWLSYTAKYVDTFCSLSLNTVIRSVDTGSCFHTKAANHTLKEKKPDQKILFFHDENWFWSFESGNFRKIFTFPIVIHM